MPVIEPGRVVEFESGLRWRVLFPDDEHVAASSYLRELAASDCSFGTLRSYAFDLLRWFRFLHCRRCGSGWSGCRCSKSAARMSELACTLSRSGSLAQGSAAQGDSYM